MPTLDTQGGVGARSLGRDIVVFMSGLHIDAYLNSLQCNLFIDDLFKVFCVYMYSLS